MSKSEDPLDESMTVVKTGTCDTLTKKSKLTYQIGTLPDGEVYFRIHKNTGNGFFSREWIALADIQKTIGKIPAGKPITAIVLSELFEGRSVNSPGFALAALVEEKLLVPMQGKKRSHEPVSPDEFRERVRQGQTPKENGEDHTGGQKKGSDQEASGCEAEGAKSRLRDTLSPNHSPRTIHSPRNVRPLFLLGKSPPQYRPYTDPGSLFPFQRLTTNGEIMTFITLAMMAFLCLFIPIALPVSAISAVILLYFYPQQTLALLVVLALVGVAYLYLNHRRKRRAY